MKTTINLNSLTREQRKQLNSIARKQGYHSCTKCIVNTDTTEIQIKHIPYGFQTNSGKFFEHVSTTKWFASGCYQNAQTIITLPQQNEII